VRSTSVRAELRVLRREPHFGRLYATRLVSQAADGALQVSLASAVFFSPEHSTDARAAAAGFAVLLLPYSLVGPFAGVLIDRWPRQRMLMAANVVRAAIVCGVSGLLLAAGGTGIAFSVCALAAISVNRFYLAGLAASLPHVVRRDLLLVANSVSTTSGNLATLLGGLLGLGLQALSGAVLGTGTSNATVALAAAGGFLLAARVVAGFTEPGLLGPDVLTVPDAPVSLRAALGEVVVGVLAGARHVLSRRPAAYALAAIAAGRFLYGLSTIATLLLYRNYFTESGLFRAGLVGLGQVVIAGGVGVVLAATVTPSATQAIGKPAWITTLFASAALVEVAVGLPYTMPALLVAALLLGFVAQGVKISVDTTLQETVDDSVRGRVFAFYDTLFNVTFVAAAALGAVVLPATGKSVAVLGAIAVGYAGIALVYGVASRRLVAPIIPAVLDAPGGEAATAPLTP